jgi:hypothetical protein
MRSAGDCCRCRACALITVLSKHASKVVCQCRMAGLARVRHLKFAQRGAHGLPQRKWLHV